MQRTTTKRFYIIHSWMGALTAILIFVLAVTGAASVFGRPELKIWANEPIHHPVEHSSAAIEKLVRDRADEVPAEYLGEVVVLFPGVRRSSNVVVYFENESEREDGTVRHHIIRFDHDPSTLEFKGRREGEALELFETDRKDMADFLIKFHADLHLGDPWGLLLTGLLGLTLFASTVTGVITHRKILKEAFTFRPFRSLRLLFTDSHKVLGVWGLLFHGTIGFTGAFLGLAVVILFPAAAYVSMGGDTEALVEKYLPLGAPERSGITAELRLADVLDDARSRGTGPILAANLLEADDRNGVILVNTLAGEDLVGQTLRYRIEGTVLEESYTTFSRVGGAAGSILDAMFPLHFGNFAGIWVKFLWFFLGLSTAFLSVSGMMIWIERRVHGSAGEMSVIAYRRISRFTVGACAGVVIATVSLFHAQLLLDASAQTAGFWIGTVFFGSWIACIVWSMLRTNEYRSTKELIGIAGFLCIAVPPLNASITGNHLLNAWRDGHVVTGAVDLTLLLLGLAMLAVAVRLPAQRPLRKGKFGGQQPAVRDEAPLEVTA
ncbi:MAG: PepSY-associated TM helix domain-containing protein [Pseudomonadota bacterium]